jgi:uncharacterized metal-binding protein
MENETCSCNITRTKTVFACSGAADLGEVSDMVARKLHREGVRQMKCLAFVGGGIQDMINSVKGTDMLVIDGCNLDCGKLTMEKNGISDFYHMRLSDLGYVKGQTPASVEVTNEIARHAMAMG